MKYSIYGEDATQSEISAARNEIGTTCQYMGRLEEAETMLKKALDMGY